MPRYDYACDTCGSVQTLTRGMRDSHEPVICGGCGGLCRKKPNGIVGLLRGVGSRQGWSGAGTPPSGMPGPTALHLGGNSTMKDCYLDGAGVSVSGTNNAILGSAMINVNTAIATAANTDRLVVKGNVHTPRDVDGRPPTANPSSALVLGDADNCTFQRVDSDADVLVTGIAKGSQFEAVALQPGGEEG